MFKKNKIKYLNIKKVSAKNPKHMTEQVYAMMYTITSAYCN